MEQEAGDARGRRRLRPASDADSLRVPPHSVEAEQAVLGGLLLDNSTWDAIADRLTAEDFYRRDHQHIFTAVAELSARGEPSDAVTLAEYLAAKSLGEDTGGPPTSRASPATRPPRPTSARTPTSSASARCCVS